MAENRGPLVVIRYAPPDGSEEQIESLGPGESITAGRGTGANFTFDGSSDSVSRQAVKFEVHTDRVVVVNTSLTKAVRYRDAEGVISDLRPSDSHEFRNNGSVTVPDYEASVDFVLEVEFSTLPAKQTPPVDSEEPETRNPDQEAWDKLTDKRKEVLTALVAGYFFDDLSDIPYKTVPTYKQLARLTNTTERAVSNQINQVAVFLDPEDNDAVVYYTGKEKRDKGKLVGREFRNAPGRESLANWVVSAGLVTEDAVRDLPGFANFERRSDKT